MFPTRGDVVVVMEAMVGLKVYLLDNGGCGGLVVLLHTTAIKTIILLLRLLCPVYLYTIHIVSISFFLNNVDFVCFQDPW